MINHTFVEVAIGLTMIAAAAFVIAVYPPTPRPKPVVIELEESLVVKALPLSTEQKKQIVIDQLEDKLKSAEKNLDEITRLIQLQAASKNADQLDRVEDKPDASRRE
jgi:hypothetical protein